MRTRQPLVVAIGLVVGLFALPALGQIEHEFCIPAPDCDCDHVTMVCNIDPGDNVALQCCANDPALADYTLYLNTCDTPEECEFELDPAGPWDGKLRLPPGMHLESSLVLELEDGVPTGNVLERGAIINIADLTGWIVGRAAISLNDGGTASGLEVVGLGWRQGIPGIGHYSGISTVEDCRITSVGMATVAFPTPPEGGAVEAYVLRNLIKETFIGIGAAPAIWQEQDLCGEEPLCATSNATLRMHIQQNRVEGPYVSAPPPEDPGPQFGILLLANTAGSNNWVDFFTERNLVKGNLVGVEYQMRCGFIIDEDCEGNVGRWISVGDEFVNNYEHQIAISGSFHAYAPGEHPPVNMEDYSSEVHLLDSTFEGDADVYAVAGNSTYPWDYDPDEPGNEGASAENVTTRLLIRGADGDGVITVSLAGDVYGQACPYDATLTMIGSDEALDRTNELDIDYLPDRCQTE